MARLLTLYIPTVLLLFVPAVCADPPASQAKHTDSNGDPLPANASLRLGSIRLRHSAAVQALLFSSDGQTLASADSGGRVVLWDVRTCDLRWELPVGTGTAITFASDGKLLATGGEEQPVRLWSVADGREVRTLEGASGRPLAFSPDGKALLGADKEAAILYEVESGGEMRRFQGLGQPPSAVAFSRDGRTVAVGGMGGPPPAGLTGDGNCVIVLFEAGTGKELRRISNAHHGSVQSLTFSPDGRLLAAASPYHVRLWDLSNGERLAQLPRGASGAVSFDHSGKRLATAGDICVWDSERRVLVRRMSQGANFARVAALSPDGKLIASNAVHDCRIRLWEADSGREKFASDAHPDQVGAVAVSPDGLRIATGCGSDHTVRLWDAATGAPVRSLKFDCGLPGRWCATREAVALAFSPDGRHIVSGSIEHIHVWDVASGAEVRQLEDTTHPFAMDFVTTLAFSPDGRLLASGGRDAGVRLWDFASGKLLRRIWPQGEDKRQESRVTSLAFAPDGKVLAAGSEGPRQRMLAPDIGGLEWLGDSMDFWDVATGKRVGGLRPNAAAPNFLAFSPDGQLVATSATKDVPPQLWDRTEGKKLHDLTGPDGRSPSDLFNALTFAPDGQVLAVAGADGTVVLWEALTGQPVRVLEGHHGAICMLAFAPHGQTLVSGSVDTTALVWPVVPAADAAIRPAESLWRDLAADAATAYPAVWALVAAPERTVPLLKERLRPEPEISDAELKKLVTDLGEGKFQARQEAARRLQHIGVRAVPSLRQALAGQTDLERRRRIEKLLGTLDGKAPDPEVLREARAVQVLERLGTPPAEELLRALARGANAASLTRAARGALARLESRRARPAQRKES